MKETPSLPEPYPCDNEVRGLDIAFIFETDRKVRYEACFFDYMYMLGSVDLGCRVFMFNLEVVHENEIRPPKGTPPDEQIEATIAWVFREFFATIEHAAITICDSTDGREQARFRKFDSWYEKWKDKGDGIRIDKIDYVFQGEDYNFLSSLFVREDFPRKEELEQTYQRLIENGNVPLD